VQFGLTEETLVALDAARVDGGTGEACAGFLKKEKSELWPFTGAAAFGGMSMVLLIFSVGFDKILQLSFNKDVGRKKSLSSVRVQAE
jgi:hypothetical protein